MARFLAIERETVFLKALIDEARRLLGRELTGTELKRIKLPQPNGIAGLTRSNRLQTPGSRAARDSGKHPRRTAEIPPSNE
jgi:hypothetical protein